MIKKFSEFMKDKLNQDELDQQRASDNGMPEPPESDNDSTEGEPEESGDQPEDDQEIDHQETGE